MIKLGIGSQLKSRNYAFERDLRDENKSMRRS